MPRHEKISDKKLFELLDKFCYEQNPWVIKVPQFGDFVRSHGYPDVDDYLIRRHRPVIDEIKNRNSPNVEEYEITVATYLPLNIQDFLQKNNTTEKIADAIARRESYYSNLAKSAGKIIQEKQTFHEEKQQLQQEVMRLQSELQRTEKYKAENTELKKENKLLRDLINETVNPSVANEILYSHGIVLTREGIADPQKVNDIVDLSSDVNALKEHLTKTLLAGIGPIDTEGGGSDD